MEHLESIQPESSESLSRKQFWLLLATAAVSSSCGLAAELLLGTLASYLVGNQALAYGVAVGGFLAAMGIGSYLSQFIFARGDRNQQYHYLLTSFIKVELSIAPLTALLPLGLFALFVAGGPVWIGLGLATLLLGMLAGMEVPLITRLVELDQELRNAIAQVLAWDYVGALIGALAFPAILLPTVGLFPAAALIGALPAAMVFILGNNFPRMGSWRRWGGLLVIGLCAFSLCALPLGNRLEDNLYGAPIMLRTQSAYQRIVVTRQAKDVRLFLDGDLQLSTWDEYRYHEALVHPAMSASPNRRRVLLLGAGDGMALREILKWPEAEQILVIELDPSVVNVAQRYPALVAANENSFDDPRVKVLHGDAFQLVSQLSNKFDVIIADFPDPDQAVVAKLYSKGFYQQIEQQLADAGIFVTQASSPFFAPKVFACITETLKTANLNTYPYTVSVPSFGPWGFVMASRQSIDTEALELPVSTQFLTASLMHNLFTLPKDIQVEAVKINRLANPIIVKYQSDPRWAWYN
ncbi:MAG: polyamine aminopropyltransferase [Cyanobacteria bacterium P01_D01_bin.56]